MLLLDPPVVRLQLPQRLEAATRTPYVDTNNLLYMYSNFPWSADVSTFSKSSPPCSVERCATVVRSCSGYSITSLLLNNGIARPLGTMAGPD